MNAGIRKNTWKVSCNDVKWRQIGTTQADILHAIGRLITRHWPTYYTQLADLLHAIGRLITPNCATYYTQLADLLHAIGRLITCTLDTRSDELRRRCGFAGRPWQPTRHPTYVFDGPGERWPTYDTARPTYYTRGSGGRQAGARLGRGLGACQLG